VGQLVHQQSFAGAFEGWNRQQHLVDVVTLDQGLDPFGTVDREGLEGASVQPSIVVEETHDAELGVVAQGLEQHHPSAPCPVDQRS
jgi:hypothetical protein